jgi:hypothetical protein
MPLRYTGGFKVKLNGVFISVVHGGQLSASRSGHFTSEERAPFVQQIWTWMGSRVGLDDPTKRKNFCMKSNSWHPAIVSLYWLSYLSLKDGSNRLHKPVVRPLLPSYMLLLDPQDTLLWLRPAERNY